MPNQEQIKRMNDINDLIKLIADIDRRTFFCKQMNRKAYFRFKKKLFFVDDYTGADVYPYEMGYGSPNGFSHGGNMWQLVNSFRKFIITGKYGELRDYKEIWAYSYEGCMKIRQKAKEIGFIESVDYPYSFDDWMITY
ncbi:hypothetical protein MOC76_16580 [Bacillus spizizenii]|uniref:hypothetical protein n=1 Tax=Bacillus spizizenii TaxID=96241 RepID=UPI00227DC6C8|nr:hypothetical protein [Bacillus spizizenii]MCY7959559.1 hypothetical protein [Bacillus spizizenii]MCY7989948.1 hypothetical protein [Bacillus spizizenii]MCY7996746.1 hypothetical protein [Bacillus spizizenii]MCY8063908.1 hypothetical protein [Bacillus spizizenii]MCY8135378.1 hypothetical protein [Bacillus spizizenii]